MPSSVEDKKKVH